ncbi:MAG: PAS domain S-box protein, partial [Colwellia sp.]|nr:PAS domain S-box protein [Colwellia sp.]
MVTKTNSEKINAELLDKFFKDIPTALVGNIINSFLIVFLMWNSVPNNYLEIWFLSMLLVLALRFGLYRRFQINTNKNDAKWKITGISLMAFTGIVWALMPVLVVGYGESIDLTFLILIMSGVSAGALASSAAYRTAYILFVLPPILTLSLFLLFYGEEDYFTFALLIPVFFIILVRGNQAQHKLLYESLALRYSNLDLVQKVKLVSKENELGTASQKIISSKLKESEAIFSSLAEVSEVIIFAYEHSRHFLYVNPAGKRLMGDDFHTYNKKKVSEYAHPDDLPMMHQYSEKLFKGEEIPRSFQVRIIDHLGETYWLAISITLITYGGQPALIAIGIDITELKIAESRLIQEKDRAEKANKAKSAFLSSMSHELRTPLNAILGFAQITSMFDSDTLSKDQKENIGHIISSGEHLLNLINGVLELSSIESGKMELFIEQVHLINIINDSVTLLTPVAQNANINLSVLSHSDLIVRTDQTKLKQVIINLVTNGIKYNQAGGSVSLEWYKKEKNMIRINVIDTGKGISDEYKDYVFDPFNRLGLENS